MAEHLDPADVRIEPTDARGPEAAELIGRLARELGALYCDDGSGNFSPADVGVPGSAFLVARLRGRPVGCGAFRPMEPGVAEIKRMYVAPDVRGLGLGQRLLAELEVHARRAGYAAVRLETGVHQAAALRLYESAGYRRIANYGIYRDNPLSVCFEKDLPG
jgi:ribosomal protein S18 acetylase RimI-like enzyme